MAFSIQQLRKDKRWLWVALGLAAVGVRLIGNLSPQSVENVYSQGLFQGIRWVLDYSLGFLPIPLIYLLAILVLFFLWKWIQRISKNGKGQSFVKSLFSFILDLLGIAGALVFFFLFLWGFNYGRVSIEEKLGLVPKPLDSIQTQTEVEMMLALSRETRDLIPDGKDTIALTREVIPNRLENRIRAELTSLLEEMGYTTPGRVRVVKVHPQGLLMRFGIAGIYLPYTGQGNFDAGLHPLTHPYTLAHEMAHGYGFTDEGVCNFLAYLTCMRSSDPVIRYSGYLSHTMDVLVAYRRFLGNSYGEFRSQIDPGVISDINAINAANARFADWLPSNQINNYFLKSQGVKEGILSYRRVVMLVKAWREKEKNQE